MSDAPTDRAREPVTEPQPVTDPQPVTASQHARLPQLARLPEPPYAAVIFTSRRTRGDNGYAVMAARMDELAARQPGYLAHESARGVDDGAIGITVSYWVDEAAARAWKQVQAHLVAQERGRSAWYADYTVRVCTVERAYDPGDRA